MAPDLPPLRLVVCGSVDDGKSTLIGRLLWETGAITDDHLAALHRDSRRHGTTGAEPDLALLLDGLHDERDQGITIDVAWRRIDTPRRRLLLADAPGHVQYTRNMATAASTADVALVLVDATRGLQPQTRRHLAIAALLGVRHAVLAVNKMDLAGYDQATFTRHRDAFAAAAAPLNLATLAAIPLSARHGDNVATRSPNLPWHAGPPLLQVLEECRADPNEAAAAPLRLPVQITLRGAGLRAHAGTIAAGTVRVGDPIAVAPSGAQTRVARILALDGDAPSATVGDATALVLADDIAVARGDVLHAGSPPITATRFEANLVWLAPVELFPGRSYLVKLGTATVPATIDRIRHRLDLGAFTPQPAATLRENEIGRATLTLARPLVLAPHAESRVLGGFIVIDRHTNATLAAGMVTEPMPAAAAVTWHETVVDKAARAALKGQRPCAVWFTGLSGAGKSTIANLVERRLLALGRHAMILDGDNVRHGLNRDLGFSEADRVENIRRAAEVARLMVEAGLIVLVGFISPYRAEREAARERFEPGEFLEVFVDTPVAECRRRDPKGLYRRADAGLLRNLTGVDAPYEPPVSPDLHLRTTEAPPEALADRVVTLLQARGHLNPRDGA